MLTTSVRFTLGMNREETAAACFISADQLYTKGYKFRFNHETVLSEFVVLDILEPRTSSVDGLKLHRHGNSGILCVTLPRPYGAWTYILSSQSVLGLLVEAANSKGSKTLR